MRRELMPTFGADALRGYLPAVQQLSEATVERWLQEWRTESGGQVHAMCTGLLAWPVCTAAVSGVCMGNSASRAAAVHSGCVPFDEPVTAYGHACSA
jgi:hypothetical protein